MKRRIIKLTLSDPDTGEVIDQLLLAYSSTKVRDTEMTDQPIDGKRFRAIWKSIPDATKEKIRWKAAHEHMSVSAVIRSWWPQWWQKVTADSSVSEHTQIRRENK